MNNQRDKQGDNQGNNQGDKNKNMKSALVLLTALGTQIGNTAPQPKLVAHEWGTFTSLQGSNGEVQEGLYHEEESLPGFVHGRDPLHEQRLRPGPQPGHTPPPCRGKCFEYGTPAETPLAVTQKMETPVIYFYSDQEQRIQVDVGFPQGIITQYYPNPISFNPPIGGVSSLSGGNVSFAVDLLKSPLNLPAVDSSNVYAPARNVHADFIKSGNENERFIFYRGLGNFSTTLQVTSGSPGVGTLRLSNRGKEAIPAVFLVNVTSSGGSIQLLGNISGGNDLLVNAKRLISFRSEAQPLCQFMLKADQLLTSALTDTGLYQSEAQAMTDTWKKSYFKTPGLRVLYILPREETDRILPLRIQPQPQELVRTMVGRVEVLLSEDEIELLALIHKKGEAFFDVTQLGRFGEAKLRRVLQLATDSRDQLTIQDLLSRF